MFYFLQSLISVDRFSETLLFERFSGVLTLTFCSAKIISSKRKDPSMSLIHLPFALNNWPLARQKKRPAQALERLCQPDGRFP
jgi:hypothetical protein